MTNDEILARFPGPVRLYPSRWKWALAFVFFGLLALSLIDHPSKFKSTFSVGLFGLIALINLLALLPWANSLTLRPDRLQWSFAFRRWTIPWKDAHSFAVTGLAPNANVIFRYERKNDAGMPWLGGRNFGFSHRFGRSPDELAALLTKWRELSLAAQGAPVVMPAMAQPTPETPAVHTLSQAAADLLARYPGPLTLRAGSALVSRASTLLEWPVLAFAFLVSCYAVMRLWEISATAGIVLLVVLGALGALTFIGRGPQRSLTLSAHGFEVARGFWRGRWPWSSTQDFIAMRLFNSTRVAFNVGGQPALWSGERADRPPSPLNTAAAMVFRTTTLPESYFLPDNDLAALMTHWRERALSGAHRGPTDHVPVEQGPADDAAASEDPGPQRRVAQG